MPLGNHFKGGLARDIWHKLFGRQMCKTLTIEYPIIGRTLATPNLGSGRTVAGIQPIAERGYAWTTSQT